MPIPEAPDDSAIRKSWIEWPCHKSRNAMAIIQGIRIRLRKVGKDAEKNEEESNRVADLFYLAGQIQGLEQLVEKLSKEKKPTRKARAEKFRKTHALLRKKLAKAAERNGISPAVLGIEEIQD